MPHHLTTSQTNNELCQYTSALPLEPCIPSDLPAAAVACFAVRSKCATGEPAQPADYLEFARVPSAPVTAYIGHLMITHENGLIEEELYIADVTEDGTLAGYGTVRKLQNPVLPELQDIPFVGYTKTLQTPEQDYRRQGLGMRRLFVMQNAAQQVLSGPLHSGFTREPAADRLWKRLAQDDIAEEVQLGSHARYRFKP